MRTRQHSSFLTITSEGALLPIDILQKIALFDSEINGLDGESYNLVGIRLNEAISASWGRLLSAWQSFQGVRGKLREDESGLAQTRERWLLSLFQELGYGRLYTVKPLEIDEKSYPISHSWQHLPMHLVSFRSDLDQLTGNATNGYRFSPYSLVQEFLNRSPEHLWGLVSNGLRLRLLRKNASLTRQAYVEFDLEAMFTGESYADFSLFWLLCHQSRVESEHPAECWLERWSRLAQEQGVRVLKQLRNGVEEAINLLGGGFLAHPTNGELREKLRSGDLKAQDYYNQVLRFVYRLLILFVAEDRDILFDPASGLFARQRYAQYYSTARLRRIAGLRLGTRHSDLFRALWLVMEQLGNEVGCQPLGLPALNGFLFSSSRALPDLIGCEMENTTLLAAIRALAFTEEKAIRRTVDYKNLGAEELGSVYESLLELHPQLDVESASFKLAEVSGNARKTSGSYYTPTSLIDCLLDSALEPVLAEAYASANPEKAILALKVCDPACGSGHFLIATAHRIARRLAAVRTGTEEPAAEARRAALRDVVGHCIYGVDINPMAVELCKVNLWMEAIEPGKPLSFLDAHIQCGNSLLGSTPALLRDGIPDSAFEPIEGDDKKFCSEYKRKNKALRAGQASLFDEELRPWNQLGNLSSGMVQLEEIGDATVAAVHRMQELYARLVSSEDYLNGRLLADAWCAAFVWKKTSAFAYPITHEIFRNIEKNPFNVVSWMKEEIMRLAQQYQFFHWHLAFPDVFRVPARDEEPENSDAGWSGGFDVVLGNPPWERIKIQEKEWFAARKPAIAEAPNAAQRRRLIAALRYEDPELYAAFMDDQRQATGESHIVRDSGRYPLCGRGDVNTYAIFAENLRSLINLRGRSGCIIPSGIATDDTYKLFFANLMATQTLASLFDFRNELKLFPSIDHQVKFALLTITGQLEKTISADFAFGLYRTEDISQENRHFSLSDDDIALLNPNTHTCPVFRSRRDMILTKEIYERVPILVQEGPTASNSWGISLSTMFHMSNDAHLFRSQKQLSEEGWKLTMNAFQKGEELYSPLYEGKMISLFDHRFGTYEGMLQNDRELNQIEHTNPWSLPLPRYWIHSSHLSSANNNQRQGSLVFRVIARSTDSRTGIFCLLPNVPCGNSIALVIMDSSQEKELVWFNSCASSFIFDYVLRQKLGGPNLNFFIMKQMPIIPLERYKKPCLWYKELNLGAWILPFMLELIYTSWDLRLFAKNCGYEGPPFIWQEERRSLIRCELDAAYFHLFGIKRTDVDYILETFPIVKQRDEEQHGEYRTKRVILEVYDEMARAMETGEAYRTRLDPPAADAAVAHAGRTGAEV